LRAALGWLFLGGPSARFGASLARHPSSLIGLSRRGTPRRSTKDGAMFQFGLIKCNEHGPSEQSGFSVDHNWDTLRRSEREG
jgi:hypothetical protein